MGAALQPDVAQPSEDGFVHVAVPYRGTRGYLAVTVPFVQGGIAAGDPVGVAVPGPRLDALRAALGPGSDRVRFVDMAEAGRNPGRIIPAVLLAFADADRGAARVRIIGEPVWAGRSAIEYPACVQHEALINDVFAGRSVTVMCPYDAENLPPYALTDMATTHPYIADDGVMVESVRYDPGYGVAVGNRPLPQPLAARSLRVSASRLREARALAVAEARRAGLAEDRVFDFELVVSELATNSIDHAGQEAVLRVWTEAGQLVADIRNRGNLTDPLAGRVPPGPGELRGRGLLLVNHLVDLVRARTGDGSTTVRVYLRITGRAVS